MRCNINCMFRRVHIIRICHFYRNWLLLPPWPNYTHDWIKADLVYHVICDVKDSVRGYRSYERDERVKRPSTSHNTTILYDRASDRVCLMSRQLA
jgi:hypothetical protein